VLQHIIPDIVAKDVDNNADAPSCSKKTLIEVKTHSPGDAYPDDRTGDSNAAANARQVRVSAPRLPCQRNRGRSDSRAPFLLRRQGLEDSQGLLPAGALSCMGAQRSSWKGTSYA